MLGRWHSADPDPLESSGSSSGQAKRLGLGNQKEWREGERNRQEENVKEKENKTHTGTEAEEAVIEKKKMETDAQLATAVRLEHVVPPAKKKRKTTTDTSGGAPEDTRGLRHGREGAAMEGRALQRSPSFEEPPVELAPTPPSTFSGARML
jgi:hypothetical protein